MSIVAIIYDHIQIIVYMTWVCIVYVLHTELLTTTAMHNRLNLCLRHPKYVIFLFPACHTKGTIVATGAFGDLRSKSKMFFFPILYSNKSKNQLTNNFVCSIV